MIVQFVIGWGATAFKGQQSPILLQLQIPIVDNNRCREIMRQLNILKHEIQFSDMVNKLFFSIKTKIRIKVIHLFIQIHPIPSDLCRKHVWSGNGTFALNSFDGHAILHSFTFQF